MWLRLCSTTSRMSSHLQHRVFLMSKYGRAIEMLILGEHICKNISGCCKYQFVLTFQGGTLQDWLQLCVICAMCICRLLSMLVCVFYRQSFTKILNTYRSSANLQYFTMTSKEFASDSSWWAGHRSSHLRLSDGDQTTSQIVWKNSPKVAKFIKRIVKNVLTDKIRF